MGNDLLDMLDDINREVLFFEGHPAGELDLEQKDLYVRGLTLMMEVDGLHHEKEIDYIKILISSLELDLDNLEVYIDFASSPSKDAVVEIMSFLQESGLKSVFLVDATTLAYCDGEFHDREKLLIQKLKTMLKVTDSQMTEIEALVEGIRTQNERDVLRLLIRKDTSLKREQFDYLLKYYGFDPEALKSGEWQKVEESSAFSPRWGHGSTVFNNALYIIGGNDGKPKNDVWRSTNGKEWEKLTESAPFAPRYCHNLVVFKDALWIIGGTGEKLGKTEPILSELWRSTDGRNWERLPFPHTLRKGHTSVVFECKLYIFNGQEANTESEGWGSSNGKDWSKCEQDELPEAVSHGAATAMDGELFFSGGQQVQVSSLSYNSGGSIELIWMMNTLSSFASMASKKIITTSYIQKRKSESLWNNHGNNSFHDRAFHGFSMFDQALWVVGGESYYYYCNRIVEGIPSNDAKIEDNSELLNDVWMSEDGTNWIRQKGEIPFSPRKGHTLITFQNSLWLIGGKDEIGLCNDIWRMD